MKEYINNPNRIPNLSIIYPPTNARTILGNDANVNNKLYYNSSIFNSSFRGMAKMAGKSKNPK